MKKILSIIFIVTMIINVLPLYVGADVEPPNSVKYKGGLLDDYYSHYTVDGNISVSTDTNLNLQNKLIIKNGAVLYIEKGVTLEINGNLHIEKGGKLIVKNNATLVINHENGYTKIDGILQGNKNSSLLIKNGNVIIEKNGRIHYNGEFKEAEDFGKYKIAVLGKISKGKDGTRTVKVSKKSDNNIILSGFPNMPVISLNTKSLRFDEYTKIKSENISQLNNLKYLAKLEKLELYGDVQIENLNMLTNLKNLKYLDLGYIWVLDISSLSKINSLETLVVNQHCLWDKNFEALKGLKSLKTLDISRMDGGIIDFEEKIDELKKALPDTKIIYGDDVFTGLYESFYAKVTYTKKFPNKFILCDKNGKIISDYEFYLRSIDYAYSDCEYGAVTQYFNQEGKSDYFRLIEGDVIKIYYDYRDTADGYAYGKDMRIGLTVEEINIQKPDYNVNVYAYRIDMISSVNNYT